MLTTLAKIMDKFDIDEIKDNPGLFGKIFGNLRKQLDKILAKYHTMGDEVGSTASPHSLRSEDPGCAALTSSKPAAGSESQIESNCPRWLPCHSAAVQYMPQSPYIPALLIKTMEFSNMNLVRKINSAFIVTLPVFKQALAQAIMLKRQRIQAEAMSALDEKTNEMLPWLSLLFVLLIN